jgi:hypothetical protein
MAKMEALEMQSERLGHKLPGGRGRALQVETIMPWPNLAVTSATITGKYDMTAKRKAGRGISVTLQPSSRQTSYRDVCKVKTKVVLRGGERPAALTRIEYSLRKALIGFLTHDVESGPDSHSS